MGWGGGADMRRDGLWEKEEKRGSFKVRKESRDDMSAQTPCWLVGDAVPALNGSITRGRGSCFYSLSLQMK